MKESKKIEDFLLMFGIEFCEPLDCYMIGWDGERGKRITPIAIRKAVEFYYYTKKDTTTLKSLGCKYFPLSVDKEFIKRISEINGEIAKEDLRILNKRVKDLQHFKDSSVGLWCTDKEPIDKANYFQLK